MENKHMFDNTALKALLLPLIIEQLLNSLMGMIDTIMVSNVGPTAMSAVSLVDSINLLVIQAFGALAAGGCIVCSQYIGKKDFSAATRAAKQVFFASLMISVVLTLGCLLFNRPLLHLTFGTVEQAVMDDSVIYFFYTAMSFPFLALYHAGAAVYRAQGNSRFPMTVSITSNLINIVGNAILIWGFRMGVTGVAIPTLVSRIFCAVIVLVYLRRPNQTMCIRDYFKIRPEKDLLLKVLRIGIPSGIENSMFQFGKLVIQSTISTMGTVAIAAQAMTSILEVLNGVAASGVGIALMTIAGQCIGTGRKEEAIYYTKKLTMLGEITLVISCIIVLAISWPVTKIAAMEPESAALCMRMMIWITLIKPLFWVLSFVPVNALRAGGDVKFAMIVSTISMWVCRVSLCVFLVKVFHFGPMAVWIGMFTDWAVRGFLFVGRFYSGKWLEHKVIS